MAEPLISVIIPAYNHERFVGAAVDSVLTQSGVELELIVVDDGSTDRTGAVVQSRRDPRLRYLHQTNQDAYNALNHGLSLARGTHIAILNSDDLYVPGRLGACLEACRAGAEVVFTHVGLVDEAGRNIPAGSHYWHVWHERNRQYYFDRGDLYDAFLRGNLLIGTSNLFLTVEAARRVGAFAPLRYLHDYDYIFRLLLACPGGVRYLHDRVLLHYRIHGGNTLKQGEIVAREQDQALIRRYALLGMTDETSRRRAETALARLAELDSELHAIRGQARWGRLQPLARGAHRLLFPRRSPISKKREGA
jgi:glycosyltransferase involved in cell wall biosynthesis